MMEGTLTADSASLRNALRWTGQPSARPGGFGRFALKARANVVGASVALTNVNVELDGNVAEGVMTYANNGRQTLQATLAAGTLDFTPYVSTVRLLASGARDWNRQLFDLQCAVGHRPRHAAVGGEGHRRLDQARPHRARRQPAQRHAGALASAKRRCMAGSPKDRSASARSDAVADVKAQFQFTDVDLQACASDLFGISKLSGRGNLNVSLEASGASPFGLAAIARRHGAPDRA